MHLLLAWDNCTRKTDEAVSAQISQLLVSILPSCPSTIAVPLLMEIRESLLRQNKEKQVFLSEGAEFCTAMALRIHLTIRKLPLTGMLSNDVRAEILELLWQVLMHPDKKLWESIWRNNEEQVLAISTRNISSSINERGDPGNTSSMEDELLSIEMVKICEANDLVADEGLLQLKQVIEMRDGIMVVGMSGVGKVCLSRNAI
jgi:hypothetical protein